MDSQAVPEVLTTALACLNLWAMWVHQPSTNHPPTIHQYLHILRATCSICIVHQSSTADPLTMTRSAGPEIVMFREMMRFAMDKALDSSGYPPKPSQTLFGGRFAGRFAGLAQPPVPIQLRGFEGSLDRPIASQSPERCRSQHRPKRTCRATPNPTRLCPKYQVYKPVKKNASIYPHKTSFFTMVSLAIY